MANNSAAGLRVKIIAEPTFPAGIDVTAFPSGVEVLVIDDTEVRKHSMGLNGDLVTWQVPKAISVKITVLPETEEDKNLAILLDLEKMGKNKTTVHNQITMVVDYPNGDNVVFTGGALLSGSTATAVNTNNEFKNKSYSFIFEGKAS